MKNQGCDPKRLQAMREYMKSPWGVVEYESDQQKDLPQPPLTKPAMGGEVIPLTRDFSAVITQPNYLDLLLERKSHRNYTAKPMSLDQLAFLLWSTQGVTGIRGNYYAVFRPAPSGGARHPFETYLTVFNVDGLTPGLYHYLPMEHAVERIGDAPDRFVDTVSDILCDQQWCKRCGVVFFYSMVPYRCEWRYGTSAHKVSLLDAGHAVQNLYLSCHATGLATCAIGAYDQASADALFGLDGDEEFIIYCAPVGHIPDSEKGVTRQYP